MNQKIFELTLAVYRVTDLFPENEVLKRQIREKANELMAVFLEYELVANKTNGRFDILAKITSLRSLLGVGRFSNFIRPVNYAVLDREYEFIKVYLEKERGFDKKVEQIYLNDIVNDNSGDKRHEVSVVNSAVNRPDSAENLKKGPKPKIERSIIYSHKVSLENGNGNGNGLNDDNVSNSRNHLPVNAAAVTQKFDLLNGNGSNLNDRQKTILDYIKSNNKVRSTDLTSIFSDLSIKTLQRDLVVLLNQNVIEKEGDKRWSIYKVKA